MAHYLVLVGDDESAWETESEEQHNATYARDEEWGKRLAERGHRILAGAELGPSREARTLLPEGATEGPFAESTEWLGGFYIVESDDYDDLTELTRMLMTRQGDPIIVQPCQFGTEGPS